MESNFDLEHELKIWQNMVDKQKQKIDDLQGIITKLQLPSSNLDKKVQDYLIEIGEKDKIIQQQHSALIQLNKECEHHIAESRAHKIKLIQVSEQLQALQKSTPAPSSPAKKKDF